VTIAGTMRSPLGVFARSPLGVRGQFATSAEFPLGLGIQGGAQNTYMGSFETAYVRFPVTWATVNSPTRAYSQHAASPSWLINLYSGGRRADAGSFAGKTVTKLTFTCSAFTVVTATEVRFGITQTLPAKPHWAPAPTSYVVVPGAGTYTLDLSTPFTLGAGMMYLFPFFSDWTNPPSAGDSNDVTIDYSVIMDFA
jgi:hypothetical protein